MAGLVLSGVTAFPLLEEMRFLAKGLGLGDETSAVGQVGYNYWVLTVKLGLEEVYASHPWIAYGTDWLGFGHLVIALFCIGPLIRPWEGRPVLWAGLAACFLVIPFALIFGAFRGIPLEWRLLDCAFGVGGAVPLFYCLRLLRDIPAAPLWAAGETLPCDEMVEPSGCQNDEGGHTQDHQQGPQPGGCGQSDADTCGQRHIGRDAGRALGDEGQRGGWDNPADEFAAAPPS